MNRMKIRLPALEKNEWLVLLVFLSALVSVYLISAVLILMPIYVLITRQAKKMLPSNLREGLLFAFVGIGAVTTMLFARDTFIFDIGFTSYQGVYPLKAVYFRLVSVSFIILAFDLCFLFHVITKRALSTGLKLTAIMSYPLFGIAVIQRIFSLWANQNRPGRVASLFINENYYGAAAVGLTIIALYLFFREKGVKNRILYVGSVLCGLAGLWLSQCRAAILVAALSAVVFLCCYDNRFIFASIGIACVGLILLWIFPSVLPRLENLSEDFEQRLDYWKAAWNCFADGNYFVGQGYFSYSRIWQDYGSISSSAPHTHNIFIGSLLNFGVIGSVCLFGSAGLHIYQSLAVCRKKSMKAERALILSILTAVMLHGLLDATVVWPQVGAVTVLILGAYRAYGQMNETEKEGKNG